jgi:O-antigen/teichoic acid export membrane protein
MFGVFAGFGMGLTATKYVAEFRTTNPVKAGRILALSGLVALASGLLMAVTLIVLAPWLASRTLAAPQLSGLLQISSGLLLLSALNGAQVGALAGFESFKVIAKIGIWTGLASFPLKLGGVYLAGLSGAVWGMVATLGIGWLLNHLALRREAARLGVPLRFAGCHQEWKVLWKFSLPAVMAGAMVGPVTWSCNAMLVNQPQGYAEMGVFNAANQWWAALLFLPGVVGQVVLPILSERLGNQDTRNSGRILASAIKLNAAITLPVVIIGCLLSPYIMQLYGEGFKSGWPTLVVVLLTAGLLAIQAQAGQYIIALGRIWLGFLMNMGWGLAFIGLTMGLVHWGALGLSAARFGAYILHSTWVFWFIYSVVKKPKMSPIIIRQ